MFNLLVSGNEEEWRGAPFVVESHRCAWEYTDDHLIGAYKPADENGVHRFNEDRLPDIFNAPSIFCYERGRNGKPSLGYLTDVDHIGDKIRVLYTVTAQPEWLTRELIFENLTSFRVSNDWEMNRTHWAIKDGDLAREFTLLGHNMPAVRPNTFPIVDLDNHMFDVGFTFAGSNRTLVSQLATAVASEMGMQSIFYDDFYTPYLARPNLDTLLQGIYGDRTKLIVVFLSADYQDRTWTQTEWRSVRPLLTERNDASVMFIRVGDGDVDGVTTLDGYVEADRFNPTQLAEMIVLRARQLRRNEEALQREVFEL